MGIGMPGDVGRVESTCQSPLGFDESTCQSSLRFEAEQQASRLNLYPKGSLSITAGAAASISP